MKTLLKKRNTRAFLTQTGDWTGNLLEARQFSGLAEALAVVRELSLCDMEFYHSFADSCDGSERWDFGIPLGTRAAPPCPPTPSVPESSPEP